jgi:hypothetical protein
MAKRKVISGDNAIAEILKFVDEDAVEDDLDELLDLSDLASESDQGSYCFYIIYILSGWWMIKLSKFK